MRAVVIDRYGSISDVKISDVEKPTAGPGEILVNVKGAAVNPADLKVISGKGGGKFLHAKTSPIILGFDFSGVVDEAGSGVSDFKLGDEVFGFLPYSSKNRWGSFAEYIPIDQGMVALKPKNVSFAEAASSATTGCTALHGLRTKGGNKPGQRVLVNGASGGVGSYAVQIAKADGAEVWGRCSSGSAEFVKNLGVDKVVDYKATSLGDYSEKFDIVFDAAVSSSYGECKNILRDGGVYLTLVPSLGLVTGMVQALFSSKSCRLFLVTAKQSDFKAISELIESGKLKTPVDSTFPLEEIQTAFRKIEAGGLKGKVAVTIDS
jgi:NADPH:quinone reductase-like Zn-dependent oxidoreductase